MARFQIIQPFLERGVPLPEAGSPPWRGAPDGPTLGPALSGGRPGRPQSHPPCEPWHPTPGVPPDMAQRIEALALQTPPLSVAAIHRQVATLAAAQGTPVPMLSHGLQHHPAHRARPADVSACTAVRPIIETFDLLYRREADAPNAIWQADHTLLDMLLTDEQGHARKPWLTVILDDYSRAVAGYMVAFEAPSALHTALALRQAIWRKPEPTWQVCGIPGILYTDHGSDFTSQHLEQVCADLKIQAIFSQVGQPRGRGRIERFFNTVNQLPARAVAGLCPGRVRHPGHAGVGSAGLHPGLRALCARMSTIRRPTVPPASRRTPAGAPTAFSPSCPMSLEQLDLLLLTVAKPRRVQQDGHPLPVLALY